MWDHWVWSFNTKSKASIFVVTIIFIKSLVARYVKNLNIYEQTESQTVSVKLMNNLLN